MQRFDLEVEKISENNPKKVFVASIDYDGCLAGAKFTEAFEQIKGLSATQPEAFRIKFKALLREIHQPLIQDILKKSEDCSELVLMIGSNRQTIARDLRNAERNQNGSCFVTIPLLAEVLQELTGKTVQADLRTLEDALAGAENGHHAEIYLTNPAGNFETSAQVDAPLKRLADHKYAMTYIQMLAICQEKPDCEVIFNFYDDVTNIVKKSNEQYSAAKKSIFPDNLSVVGLTQYQDISPLATFSDMQERIRKSENKDALASSEDIELFLLVSEHIFQFAYMWREYFRKDHFQLNMQNRSIPKLCMRLDDTINANVLAFSNFLQSESFNQLQAANQAIRERKQYNEKITLKQIADAAAIVSQFSEFTMLESHRYLKTLYHNKKEAEALGYKEMMDEYARSSAETETKILAHEKPFIKSDQSIKISELPPTSYSVRLPKQYRSIAQACLLDAAWENDAPPKLNEFTLSLQHKAKVEIFENLNTNTKETFLTELNALLQTPACDHSVIISLFNELKKPNGMFANIHTSKNPIWDKIRLQFKSRNTSEQETGKAKFWHTSTYNAAIAALKTAYREKRHESDHADSAILIDYCRGNGLFKVNKTAYRKDMEKEEKRLGMKK